MTEREWKQATIVGKISLSPGKMETLGQRKGRLQDGVKKEDSVQGSDILTEEQPLRLASR